MIVSFGRLAICEILKQRNSYRFLWIPDITCSEILDYLENNSVRYRFYYTQSNGSIDDASLTDSRYEDCLLLVHHFGIKCHYNTNNFQLVIQDFTHVLLSYKSFASMPPNSFTSFRKYTRFKYGGYLRLEKSFYIIADSSFKKKNVIKYMILSLPFIQHFYNFKKKSTGSIIDATITDNIDFYYLTKFELVLLDIAFLRIKTYSICIKTYFNLRGIKVYSSDSFFSIISISNIDKKQLRWLSILGFDVYRWPSLNKYSHARAVDFSNRHIFIGHDIPYYTFILLKILNKFKIYKGLSSKDT